MSTIATTVYCPTCRADVVTHASGRCLWCGTVVSCEKCGDSAPATNVVRSRRNGGRHRFCDRHIRLARAAAKRGHPLPLTRVPFLA